MTRVPRRLRRWARTVPQDLQNLLSYGRHAPFRHQLIWVDPMSLENALAGRERIRLRHLSGQVIGGDWDLRTKPVETAKVRLGLRHWRDGVSWEETGAYENSLREIAEAGGSYDGCTNLEDVMARYATLDAVFEQVVSERRLRTRRELDRSLFREEGGVIVHVTRTGEPIWGSNGSHRLAMARALGLPSMPAQLGVVHLDSITHWRRAVSTR